MPSAHNVVVITPAQHIATANTQTLKKQDLNQKDVTVHAPILTLPHQ